MIGNRLSQSEIDEIFGKIEQVTKKMGQAGIAIFLIWLFAFVFSLIFFINNMIRRDSSDRATGATIGVFLGCVVGSLFLMICISIIVATKFNKEIQAIINEVNNEKLHFRGLHLLVGPNHRYLTLHLNYSTSEENTGIPIGAAIGQPQNRQPFLTHH
eukprot:TRINITY_DN5660_c0_g1_i2.p1 TRINITY_DN5660_c0_g1~~TRINITY_DN5660_c0_g1_i2.p1  ORF type:complete len:157 (-),score=19.90 TRINITY_DN5660_c0_g1_i2:142-612(-)